MYKLDNGMDFDECNELMENIERVDEEFGRLVKKFENKIIKLFDEECADEILYNYYGTLRWQSDQLADIYGLTPHSWNTMKSVDWYEWEDEMIMLQKRFRELMSEGWGKIIKRKLFGDLYKI